MKIENIESSTFNQIEVTRQIIVHENPRRFALIDLGKELGCFGLSWRSDLIEPIVVSSPDKQTLWIGVDRIVENMMF